MQLSRNFSLQELTKSDTAIRKGIDNEPNADQIDKLKTLCEKVLQPVRDHFGRVKVTSRIPEHLSCALPLAVEFELSQHAKAEAVDFEVLGVDNAEVADWVYANCETDQLILEYYTPGEPNSGWIHASYIPFQPRAQYMRAYREDKKTKYKPITGKAVDLT
jgi:zinc D-Ala-D-Ala carboxypeptidase